MNLKRNTPTIFVGIPTWNRPDFIRDAVNSLLSQTFQDFRCIVSDNCSEPNIAQQVKSYIENLDDQRISFYEQPVNCGENGQCHWFLDQCQEEYFLFLHDDDRLEPELIETAVNILRKNPEVSFFTSNQYLFDETGTVLESETRDYNTELLRDHLKDGVVDTPLELELQRGVFGLSGTIFRTDSLRECGLDDSRDTFPFDFNVMLRQVERHKIPWWDNRKLVGYRWHIGQVSKVNCWEYNEHHILGYKKILEARDFTGKAEIIRRSLLSFSCRRYGYILITKGQWRAGHKQLRQSVTLDPLNIRAWIYLGIATIFPPLIKPMWGNKITLQQ